MPEWEELEHRMKRLEELLGNGQGYYVRRETLQLMLEPIKDSLAEVRTSVTGARQEQADNQRNIRNIVVGALVSGFVSILVAVTVAVILH
jgi:hypothetical protein